MDKQQIQALVNKGAITHVGVAADLEKLSNKEVCEKFITKHEVAAEVIAAEPKDPAGEPETPAGEPETHAGEPEAPVVDPVEDK